MNFNLNTWVGQVTTGHGAMILGPTLLAVATGNMSWQTAVPFLAAAVIGLLWPENAPLQGAARTVAQDVETLIEAYRAGVAHGTAGAAQEPVGAAPPQPQPQSHAATTVPVLAMLAAAGLALTACAGQTPAQQAATGTAVASGLVCLADATGRIVATASTSDPNEVKAVNAAVAAGSVLLSDTACQAALANGAAAVPNVTAATR